MAFDTFLKLGDQIKGDSHDVNHKEWIEVSSFNTSMNQSGGGNISAQGTHSGGRVDIGDFALSFAMSSASPLIADFCCRGEVIPEVNIELCRAMKDKTKFMEYKLKDVMISSYTSGGASGGVIPDEQITLAASEVHWIYTPTDPEGNKTGPEVKKGWSMRENKGVAP